MAEKDETKRTWDHPSVLFADIVFTVLITLPKIIMFANNWTEVYLQIIGVIIMSVISFKIMMWLYYGVMGGKSLIQRVKN